MKKNDIKNDKNNNDKSFAKVRLNCDSGAYRKLFVTVDISDFQKNTSCII